MKVHPDKTWIPIGVAFAGLVSFVVGAFWVGSAYQQILSNQAEEKAARLAFERKLDEIVNNHVTVRQHAAWIDVLRARNQSLSIPDLPR